MKAQPLGAETPMSMQPYETALADLIEAAASPLKRNDLGRLARMHSFCQTLAAADVATGPAAQDAVHALAGRLVTLLEKLILAEAAQPDDGLALIPAASQALLQAGQGQPAAAEALLARIDAAIGGAPVASAPTQPAPVQPPEAPVMSSTPTQGGTPVSRQPHEPPATAPVGGGAVGALADEPYVSEPLVPDLHERELLEGFIEEGREHVDAIEAALLEVERSPADTNKINELFRPFHTIKGIAGFLNLRDINRLTHEVETILDLGRTSKLRITSRTVDCVFAVMDLLRTQIGELRRFMADPHGGTCPQPEMAPMMAQLRAIARGEAAGPPPPKLGAILVAQAAATAREVDEALEIQAQQPSPPQKLGEILVASGVMSGQQVDSALAEQAGAKAVLVDQTIRVDTGKLDSLVDAVGELVIAQTMVNLSGSIAASGDEKLIRSVAQVSKIVRDVQETAMGLRMVPIGATFQKMKRLVRDVARKADKRVELHISGEETELDKTVIQQISDPLVHMIRNAVDHGIEPPDERRRLGKPEAGNVYLDAHHQGDSIVIEVGDDGRGLDPAKLVAKAREKGLLGAHEQLTESQAQALILQAGFSTAEQVTDISGRGVGMDVVKRNIEALRGKIEIQSDPGQGTAFVIRLPLTLAIIDGMLVRVGDERLIIPTILIEQSLRPLRSQITTVQGRGELLQVRGELCPLIQLGQLFGYSGPTDACESLVVIAHGEGQKIGLVVDELIGQQQVVIKSLTENFKHVRGVSGAAILGDGRVGLILEPTELLRLHSASRVDSRKPGSAGRPKTAAAVS